MSEVIENTSLLGEEVKLDGVSAYAKYEADLIEWSFDPGAVSSTFRRNTGKTVFNLYDFDYSAGMLTMKFYVRGDDRLTMLKNASELVTAAKNPKVEILGDTGVETVKFGTVLDGYSIVQEDIEWYSTVTLELNAIRYEDAVTYSGSSVTKLAFVSEGTVTSGLIIKFKTSAAMDKLVITVKGEETQVITFNAPTKGVWYTIDGVNGTVIDASNINRILSTDLVKFPKVSLGSNTVSFSASVDCEASFYPVYEV